MSAKIKKLKKEILAAPLAVYTRRYPDADTQVSADLKILHAQLQSLQLEFRVIDDQTRALSREIGQAKKAQQPIESLLVAMQAQSARKGDLTRQQADIEAKILQYFELTTPPNSSGPDTRSDHPARAKLIASALRHPDPEDTSLVDSAISLHVLEDNAPHWNNYVSQHPAATIYHRTEWRQIIWESFGHTSYYLYAKDTQNKTRGILPLVHMKSRLFGNFLVSMPYFNYGGAVADSPAIEARLIGKANRLAQSLGASHVEYRDDIPRQDLAVRTDKVNMILPLPADTDALWDHFTPKLRAQIRKPQRELPEVSFGGTEYLNDFYQVFARNMRDLGTPVYGKDFFYKLLHTFPQQAQLVIIRIQSQPVGAALLIGYKDKLEIPWASTIRDVNHLSINMLLYWEVLSLAIRNGFKYFDFGRSSKDAGTYQFKKQWGAMPKQLYWHYWLAEGEAAPALNPENPKFAAAINLWKRLPVSLTRWIGPHIVKNIP